MLKEEPESSSWDKNNFSHHEMRRTMNITALIQIPLRRKILGKPWVILSMEVRALRSKIEECRRIVAKGNVVDCYAKNLNLS